MKLLTLFTTFIINCIILSNLMAQSLQWQVNFDSMTPEDFFSASLLKMKNKVGLLAGDTLITISSGGTVLSMHRFDVSEKNQVVDALNEEERLICGGVKSLRVYDYSCNLQDTVIVPNWGGVLRLWKDSSTSTYCVVTHEDMYGESQIFIYDENLALISTQRIIGEIQDIQRVGQNFVMLVYLRTTSGTLFSRVILLNNNYQPVTYRNFNDKFLQMSIADTSMLLISDRKIRILSNNLSDIRETMMMSEHLQNGNNSFTAFPEIKAVVDVGDGYMLSGTFLKYEFTPQGYYPQYQRGYLAKINYFGNLVSEKRDSGYLYSAVMLLDDYLIVVGSTYFTHPLAVFGFATVTGGVENLKENNKEFSLSQNYPNPFNPETKIKFFIPKSGLVSLKVYDLLGREISVLVDQHLLAGEHQVAFRADDRFPSGVYFAQIRVGNYFSNIKMILLK